MIHRLKGRYRRWRHTRGYGVHSPFAFNLVNDWLRPGRAYGMYGDVGIEDEVDRLERAGEVTRSRARRLLRRGRELLRLVTATRPRSLWLAPDLSSVCRVAADAAGYRAGGRLATDWRRASMLVIEGGDTSLFGAELLRWIASGRDRSMLLFDVPAGVTESLYAAMPDGLMLTGPHTTFLIRRRGMYKLRYTINLR